VKDPCIRPRSTAAAAGKIQGFFALLRMTIRDVSLIEDMFATPQNLKKSTKLHEVASLSEKDLQTMQEFPIWQLCASFS
jgi:hypothetical protein